MKEKLLIFLVFLLFTPEVLGKAFDVDEVYFFVSPDSSFKEVSYLINQSNHSIYIATYSFDNYLLGQYLLEAKKKGLDIKVMVEGSPAGGLDKSVISCLDGISVYLNKNNNYDYHHAKYAVFDNKTVLISTENFGYDGIPPDSTYGNRGWFAVIKDEDVARYLSNLFFDDLKKSEKYQGLCNRTNKIIKSGQYKPRFGKGFCKNVSIDVFTAPDATNDILNFLNNSYGKLWVEQFYIYKDWGSKSNPFLDELIQKSKGLDVKVLMDSTWYVSKKNKPNSNFNTINYLLSNGIEARLLDKSKTKLLKIHAKGVISNDSVLISSINWNEHSPRKNRELGLVIHCKEASDYFSKTFSYDWNGEEKNNSYYVVVVAVVVTLILLFRRKFYEKF